MSSDVAAALQALLRAGNGLGSLWAESVWGAGASVVGRLWETRPAPWSTHGRERVLVIAPHPDDEVCGCVGTLIRHVRSGNRVKITVVTDGSGSGALSLDPEAMRVRREEEERSGAAAIGAEVDWWGLPERDWSEVDARARLERELSAFTPTVIYAPSQLDFHPDHRRVAQVVAATLIDRSIPVRVYSIQVPLTPLISNLVHDVSDLADEMGRVRRAHTTQTESIERTARSRRYAARFYGAASQVESFCQLSGASYGQLNRELVGRFRGLRIRAWSDPIAAMVGAKERLRWRRETPRP